MTVYLGADHAGFAIKEYVKSYLEKKHIPYVDRGVHSEAKADYPLIAKKVAHDVVANKAQGILVCGTGIGMAIAANKVPGIRAAAPYDAYTASLAREHNNANVLALRGREISQRKVASILNTWFSSSFSKEERHARRVMQIARMEKS